jgi:hypothetical protein
MNRDFCDLSLEVRLTVVNSLRPLLLKKNESSAQGLAEFERPVIQETLHLYARTDAWFALGYDSFPARQGALRLTRVCLLRERREEKCQKQLPS